MEPGQDLWGNVEVFSGFSAGYQRVITVLTVLRYLSTFIIYVLKLLTHDEDYFAPEILITGFDGKVDQRCDR